MPATTNELTYARSFIGNTETDDVFNERVDRLADAFTGSREELLVVAIEESLRAQLAALMLDQPSQASVGSVSYGQQVNIQELSKQLADFRTTKGSARLTTARLVRQRER
jgi:predicted transcriptional regulator